MNQLKNKVAVVYGNGGIVETTQLDTLDEQGVDQHMDAVIKKAGKVDISFNAIGIPQKGVQGLPLTELSLESFTRPVITYTQSHFVTAKAADSYSHDMRKI